MACHSFYVGFVVDRVALGTWSLLCQYHSITATYPFIVHSFIHLSSAVIRTSGKDLVTFYSSSAPSSNKQYWIQKHINFFSAINL